MEPVTAAAGSGGRGARTSETAFNMAIAKILRTKNPEWAEDGCILAESTGQIRGDASLRPDITINQPSGVPVLIESEFYPGSNVNAEAINRLGMYLNAHENPIEQVIALRIPQELAYAEQSRIEDSISDSDFEFCVHSLKIDDLLNSSSWPVAGWVTGNIDDLADIIELASMSENILKNGMDIMEDAISRAAATMRLRCTKTPTTLEKIAKSLHQSEGEQTTRMAMAIVLNAITFHMSLTGHKGIASISEIFIEGDAEFGLYGIINCWKKIVEDINYWPVFKIAIDILKPLTEPLGSEIIRILYKGAVHLSKLGATSRHDFCGRMFQRLISDRKFLATYYTLPSSSALLAELAIGRLNRNWSKESDLKNLRIADFACGTGALLSAALNSVRSKHKRFGKDDRNIHKFLVEDVITGTDIMPAATHLTASMLAGVHPEVTFEHTSIYTLPYGTGSEVSGTRGVSLGALDLLVGEPVLPIFDTGDRRLKSTKNQMDKADSALEISDASFDLIIMNPPFTRPTSHEGSKSEIPVPSFAGLEKSSEEQKLMSDKLKKIRYSEMVGNGYAGLASNFIDIAHVKVKSADGVIALVLPQTFLAGGSWEQARSLFDTYYKDIVILSIAAAGQSDRAFSADTNMAEILLIATRGKSKGRQLVKYVNLTRRPQSIAEAVTIARKILREQDASTIQLGDEKVATIHHGSFNETGLAGIANEVPVTFAKNLKHNQFVLPRQENAIPLPIATLGTLGTVGVSHRLVHARAIGKDGLPIAPFKLVKPSSTSNPIYPILWSHNADSEKCFTVKPDYDGEAYSGCESRALAVWNSTKSKLHFNLDFRINSQPLTACLTEEESIGGRAWPNFICEQEDWELPLLLWSNSTLGLIAYWWHGGRQQLGRTIITRTTLPELPVLDVRSLKPSQIKLAKKIFERFKGVEFKPANEVWNDEARQELDRVVFTELLSLHVSDFDSSMKTLRNQWCEEPSVHGGKSTAPK